MYFLKDIKSILRRYNIQPNKRLGQNFLIDRNVRDKIIDSIRIGKEDTVFEIGPGLGTLTEELCKRAKKVIAIEKDRMLYKYLSENMRLCNLELINGDILKYGFYINPSIYSEKDIGSAYKKLKIVGNLPYYISSPILVHLLNNRDKIASMFITVQKEFAQRITANVGSKMRGAISYFIQYYGETDFLWTITKKAFYPMPQVDSCFLKIEPRPESTYLTNEEKLFKIIRKCFEKKRKTILNSLYSSGEFRSKADVLERLDIAGILPKTRPEVISLEEFIRLV